MAHHRRFGIEKWIPDKVEPSFSAPPAPGNGPMPLHTISNQARRGGESHVVTVERWAAMVQPAVPTFRSDHWQPADAHRVGLPTRR
jgi:hypothetical protein